MKRKILKGALIVACQFVLLTGVSLASEVNEEYFKFKPFEEVFSEVEGMVEDDYLEGIEDAYDEVYKLEKEMKYFTADEKWTDIDNLVEDMDEYLVEYTEEAEEYIEEFMDDVADYDFYKRDYRYGLPSFDEAYEMEFEDFVNLIPKSQRTVFKKELEKRYKNVKEAYENLIDGIEMVDKYNDEQDVLEGKRREVKSLLKSSARQKYLVITEEKVYDVYEVVYSQPQPEEFYKFLKEKEVLKVIGKKNARKLRELMKEACEEEDEYEAEELLDDIEEMLYDFWNERGDTNIEIIDELYEEIDD